MSDHFAIYENVRSSMVQTAVLLARPSPLPSTPLTPPGAAMASISKVVSTRASVTSMSSHAPVQPVDPWDGLTSDFPYHRGNQPMQTVFTQCIGALRGELSLWNLIFTPDASRQACDSFGSVAAAAVDTVLRSLHPSLTADPATLSSAPLMRHFNIFLCKADVLDTFFQYYDEIR